MDATTHDNPMASLLIGIVLLAAAVGVFRIHDRYYACVARFWGMNDRLSRPGWMRNLSLALETGFLAAIGIVLVVASLVNLAR